MSFYISEEIKEKIGKKCRYCNFQGRKIQYHYILAPEFGGTAAKDNMVPVCPLHKRKR